MVDDPRDALECFGSAPVDVLAIGTLPRAPQRRGPRRRRSGSRLAAWSEASRRRPGGADLVAHPCGAARRRWARHRDRSRAGCRGRRPAPPPGAPLPRPAAMGARRGARGRRAGPPRRATRAGGRRAPTGWRSSTTTSCPSPAGATRWPPTSRPRAPRSAACRAGSSCRCPRTGGPTDWERKRHGPRGARVGDGRPGLPARGARGGRRLRRALPARLPRGRRPRAPRHRPPAGGSCAGGRTCGTPCARPGLGRRSPSRRATPTTC